ncbi:MAG: pyridoxamine 5'-phosphate oxidase family protein, partial [Saprospiraceae bacterium]|nr:pyridoxamine 5'-phosphate oxidase family protein [Saprospiraceae bacterium]
EERWMAAERFTEHVVPGRWADARKPSASDMKKTMFIAVDIQDASVKFRAHGVGDDPEDMQLEVWAGVIPLKLSAHAPEVDDSGVANIPLPSYLIDYQR